MVRIRFEPYKPSYNPGGFRGRRSTEFEQLLHLFVSLQILFGSRRGISFLIPLLLIGAIGFGGWMFYRHNYSPERMLEGAHADWDSSDTQRQLSAISKYKELLRKTDPLEPGSRWLKDDRDTLYRRIITHELKFEKNKRSASEWVIMAWDEGIRDLRSFNDEDEEVKVFWEQAIEKLKKHKPKPKSDSLDDDGGKFKNDPRLDDIFGDGVSMLDWIAVQRPIALA